MAEVTSPPAAVPGGIFRALLPERSVEDVLSGVLTIRLGPSRFALKVLVIDKADEWRASFAEKGNHLLSGFGDNFASLTGGLAFMASQTPVMLELLHEYDADGVLPDDEWIRSHVSEPELIRAFMLVLAASYPFVATVLEILAANPDSLKLVLQEFATSQPGSGSPSTTSPEPTAGPSGKSARRSRTNSSPVT